LVSSPACEVPRKSQYAARRKPLLAAIATLSAAALLTAIAYPLSARYYARWESTNKGATVILFKGGLHIWISNAGFSYTGMREGLVAGPKSQLRSGFDPEWPFLPRFNTKSSTGATIPLYAPLLAAALPAAILIYIEASLRRRSRIGYCPTCGYDCRGLAPNSPCPECGSATRANIAAPSADQSDRASATTTAPTAPST
jgi:hypothetical protein